jgi:hypothetical protein
VNAAPPSFNATAGHLEFTLVQRCSGRLSLIAGRHKVGQLRHEVVAFAVGTDMRGTKLQIQSLGIRSDRGVMSAMLIAAVPLAFGPLGSRC